ncbi:MAG TPA: hypothetical protein VJR89_36395 [Polyangiales bacterium]|nr:hypothetical protein [Polyangiales bacterium]
MTLAPLFLVQPHLECPHGPLRAWFTAPAGAAVQLSAAGEFTESMARWMVGPGLDALRARFPADPNLLLVLDIRHMTGRPVSVRSVLMDAAREHASTFSRILIAPPLHINAVYLTGLHAAAALVGAFGPHVEITSDLDAALSHDRIAAAS